MNRKIEMITGVYQHVLLLTNKISTKLCISDEKYIRKMTLLLLTTYSCILLTIHVHDKIAKIYGYIGSYSQPHKLHSYVAENLMWSTYVPLILVTRKNDAY